MRKALLFLVILALIYGTLILIFPQQGFWVVDNGAKLIFARSLIENDFQDVNLAYPGQDLDPDFYDIPLSVRFCSIRDGKLYSVYPLFFPLVSAVLFQQFGYIGLYLFPFLAGLVVLFLTFLIARHLQIKYAEWIIPLVGLATPIFFYSLTFWEHVPATALVMVSFYVLIRSFKTPHYGGLILAGFSLAMAVWMRQELYALLTAIVIAFLIFNPNRKQLSGFIIAFIIGVIPLIIYNLQVSGSPLGFHIEKNWELSEVAQSNTLWAIISEKWRIFHSLLFQTSINRWLSAALMIPYLSLMVMVFVPALRKYRRVILVNFGVALLVSFVGLVIKFTSQDPIYESLYYCNFMIGTPLVIIAFLIMKQLNQENVRWIGFIFLTMALYTIQFSLVSPLSGAMQWGARFMLIFYPLCGILAWQAGMFIWQRKDDFPLTKIWMGLILVAVGLSLINQVRGVQLLYHKKKASEMFITESKEQPGQTIMTDVWWYPLEMGPIYFEKLFFYPRKGDGLNDATFVKLMIDLKEHGEEHFTFVTFTPQYPKYQQFFNSLPLGIASKKTYQPKNCQFMDLMFVQYTIKPIRKDNTERYAAIYLQLAKFLIEQEKWSEAQTHLQTSLSIYSHPETHFALAAVYRIQNEFEKAEMHLVESVKIDPKQRRYVRALEDLREEIRLRERTPE